MKLLIFFTGFLIGKILTDIQVLFELKEVKENDRQVNR